MTGEMEKSPPDGRALTVGDRFGSYTVREPLGAGGMGEVYRAHDSKLTRDVALKVVRGALVHDRASFVRFEREARILASLSHPHIAAVYGLEESAGISALVMELVEGATLAERLRRQGPLPVAEAVRVARQIAEAVEYAHDRGIVHRDLKPANVKLTAEGEVKVLDFGLAKVLLAEASAEEIAVQPTLTLTVADAGALIGTPAYMSPEQAEGKPVDRRADIWAFGAILFEMLTGTTAFSGATLTETLVEVVRAEPDWSRLPSETPARLRRLLRRCLRKEVRNRLQAIGDARIELEEIAAGRPGEIDEPATKPAGRVGAGVALLSALAAAALAALVAWNLRPAPEAAEPVTRFTIRLPAGQSLVGAGHQSLALSSDGARLAYVASEAEGTSRIYLRDLDALEAEPLAGTEGANDPFFSTDGQWLGFTAGGEVEKIPVRGGLVQPLALAASTYGGAWTPHDGIVVALYPSALAAIPAAGGTPRSLTRFADGEGIHQWPALLPGGRTVLFGALGGDKAKIATLDLASGERRDLVEIEGGVLPRYMPSGHLLYRQAGDLFSVSFDADRLRVTGNPVRVLPDVLQYAVSANGTLAYVAGAPVSRDSRLVWVGRDGKTKRYVDAPARNYNQPRLEPRGDRIAVDVIARTQEVWLCDPARGTSAPLTFDGLNRHGVWTPDGRRIAFMSNGGIYWRAADGSGAREQLTELPSDAAQGTLDLPYSWSPDGRELAFVRYAPGKPSRFLIAEVGDRPPGSSALPEVHPIDADAAADGAPQISPDGRWLAYAGADQLGRRQIYVRAFPGPGDVHQVSIDGGNEPQWNPSGRELFFREGDKMMVVEVGTDSDSRFAQGRPQLLFTGPYKNVFAGYVRANYDVSADGQSFLMLEPVAQDVPPLDRIQVVLHWPRELEHSSPARR